MNTKLIILMLVAMLCVSCGSDDGKLHGNVNAGVTGSVSDPKDAQFHAGGQIDFAKKPKAH